MKTSLIAAFTLITLFASAQSTGVSTIDFVQVLNDSKDETLYYYQNNWLELRKTALEKGYITDYKLVETVSTEEAPFDFILMTTYANQKDFDLAEERFQVLIKEKGELQLLNEKKPGEFRKVIFYKDAARVLFEGSL